MRKTKEPKPIGKIIHYYGAIKVAVAKFNKPISVGGEIYIKGATTDFKQSISSMQYDHKDIKRAKKGQEVGMKVKKRVRIGDKIFGAV